MKTFLLGNDFAVGADISWYPQMLKSGFVFKNKNGVEQDLLLTLREYNLNSIRLRTWVNPSNNAHSGHCSASETLDLSPTVQGKRLQNNDRLSLWRHMVRPGQASEAQGMGKPTV